MNRVIMLFSHPLFGLGVESLLRQEVGLEIVGRERDTDRAIELIKECRPDVVILDGADPACDPMSVVGRVLSEGAGTRVITLNLQDNTMCVYRGEQRVVKKVEDLVQAIKQPAFA